jgi:hypothetical protein
LEKFVTFIVLVDCGSFTETAKKLYCSQPTISNHIQQLEELFDTTLFRRSGKNVYLTRQGEILLNDQNLYEDIQFVQAKDDLMRLSGIGVIANDHGVPLFRPQDMLTRMDLAYWAGSFLQPGGHETAADSMDVAKAALAQGVVSSLQGNATYGDVNRAYFQGQAKVDHPDSELSREAFVLFMAPYLHTRINGGTLYETAGYSMGPTGTVETVTNQDTTDANGKLSKKYEMKINGKSYALTAHPKVLNGPVSPSFWQGKLIKESWLLPQKTGSDDKLIQLVVFDKTGKDAAAQAVDGSKAAGLHTAGAHVNHGNIRTQDAAAHPESASVSPFVPGAVGGLLVLLIAFLLFTRKQTR